MLMGTIQKREGNCLGQREVNIGRKKAYGGLGTTAWTKAGLAFYKWWMLVPLLADGKPESTGGLCVGRRGGVAAEE